MDFPSQKIGKCPVTVQYINIAHVIWGNNIAALKRNTTRKTPIYVAGDIFLIPKELIR